MIASENYLPTDSIHECTQATVKIICVPTPLDENKCPDLKALISATTSVAEVLQDGDLVIVESTVAPFTTKKIILPILLDVSQISLSNFDLAYSPERIDPANRNWSINTTPKVVAGINLKSKLRAETFYSKFVQNVVTCDTIEIAEAAKLLENTFRLINISFINELSVFCDKAAIDINEVIRVASSKPYGFMPFYPSIGVGGHCIPVDPLYLLHAAKEIGVPLRFIELSDQINTKMPQYYVSKARDILGMLEGKKILVIGVAYKPNVADIRETPVRDLIMGLKSQGADVYWHDDLVKIWDGETSVQITGGYDLAILATPHSYIDLTGLGSTFILRAT
jgi:UDP-N-acetyl-D-glucosamine dehydrogenase